MRRLFWFPVLLVLCFFFVGCGGGGGIAAVAALIYDTDWTLRAQPGGGLSQRITLFDANNRVVRTLAADQTSTTRQQYTIGNLTPGSYRLFVELFSGHNLSGVVTGVHNDLVTLNGNVQYRTAVGAAVLAVQVAPEAATIRVPESTQFHGIALAAGSIPTFAPASSITWQVLGGVATVSANGLATATVAGSGSVRAIYTAGGVSGAATLTVNPFVPRTAKWTVLVYLNAANDLYSYSNLNLNQMERVAQNGDVRFVVQWKQSTTLFPNSTFDGTRRYLVNPDTTSAIASQLVQDLGKTVDMGRPSTLSDFITWGKTYYPATRYALIVWNHGNGWRRGPDLPTRAVSYDDETGNAIQVWELGLALGSRTFDILAWDASLMQMLEVAREVGTNVKYVVGSEESPPGEGYPYDTVFSPFRDQPDATTQALSKSFVDGMLGVPQYASRKITQSVLDTSKLAALSTTLDNLGRKLHANLGALTGIIQSVRNDSQAYSQTGIRYFRDLIDVCERIRAATSIADVDNACTAVIAAAQDAIVWEGHNSNSPGSRGISIDFSPGNVFIGASADYARMKFAMTTFWDEFLSVAP